MIVEPLSQNPQKRFYKNSFIENAKYLLIVMKFIALLPLHGCDLYTQTFSYFSFGVMVSLMVMATHILNYIVSIFVFINSGLDLKCTGKVCKIYLCNTSAKNCLFLTFMQHYNSVAANTEHSFFGVLIYIFCLKLASNWKTLMSTWIEIDYYFQKYCSGISLPRSVKIKFILVSLLVGVEYILLMYKNYMVTVYLNQGTFSLNIYLAVVNNEVFQFYSRSLWIGAIIQVWVLKKVHIKVFTLCFCLQKY